MNDPLWPHFKPLWLDFAKVGKGVLVAGGYGLYLKQEWLLEHSETGIVIPLNRWPDTTPRATGDMDLVVSLALISDETSNTQLLAALEGQLFRVLRTPHGKRWQFFKEVGDDQQIAVELHAPTPDEPAENLSANQFAVKHKPSLGEHGVHGRHNQEAIGSELHPFQFILDELVVFVPNPVTWTVMKLSAAEDQWNRSQDPQGTAEVRRFARDQAIKHGHDVYRAVAMTTMDERDVGSEVVERVREAPPFQRASEICHRSFAGSDGWANEVLADRWRPEDLETIHGVLGSWYNS